MIIAIVEGCGYFEEIDGCDCQRPPLKLFPLSQYKFTDPCHECLVQPICTQTCIPKKKHRDFQFYKWEKKDNIKILLKGEPIVTGVIIGFLIGALCITLAKVFS